MTDNYYYEKVFKYNASKSRMRLAVLAAGCFLVFAAWELLNLVYLKSPAALVLGIAVPAIVFFFLRRYTKTDIEYQFRAAFSPCRIFSEALCAKSGQPFRLTALPSLRLMESGIFRARWK